MAGFKVIQDVADRPLAVLPVSTLTAAIGDLLELIAGSTTWAKVTSTSNFFTRKAILMETATAAASVLCQEVYPDMVVSVESGSTASTAHNGDRMAFTDENTVNNSGSDSTGQAVGFVQDGIAGTTQIYGRVLVGNGVDPDAA